MQVINKYNYTAAILAGGQNKRFGGRTKAKILIEGRPIIERTIEVLGSVFNDIIIITNNKAEFEDYKHIRMAGDIYHYKGPLAGLHSAITNSEKEAVFLVASDMPGLSLSTVEQVAMNFEKMECEALIPVYKELIEPLHAIYSRTVLVRLDDFLRSENKYSIREFLKLVDAKYLEIDDGGGQINPFFNINSPEDLQKWY